MFPHTGDLDDPLVIVRPEDRPWGLLVHSLGWIPVWGFVFNSAIWLYYKNRSREMVFHVQQAIQYQILVLIPVITWILCSILTRIIQVLSPGIGEALQTLNTLFLSLAITLLAVVAIYGGGMVYAGRPFLYPVIGRRVLEGSIRKFTER